MYPARELDEGAEDEPKYYSGHHAHRPHVDENDNLGHTAHLRTMCLASLHPLPQQDCICVSDAAMNSAK